MRIYEYVDLWYNYNFLQFMSTLKPDCSAEHEIVLSNKISPFKMRKNLGWILDRVKLEEHQTCNFCFLVDKE